MPRNRKPAMNSRKKCHFWGCASNQIDHPALKFFSIPRGRNTERTWMFLVIMRLQHLFGTDAVKDLRVCKLHFFEDMFELNYMELKLTLSAIPYPSYLVEAGVRVCGLENVGLTCYLNSVVQVFYWCKDIRSLFVQHASVYACLEKECLTCLMKNLFGLMSVSSVVPPRQVVNAVQSLKDDNGSRLFPPGIQSDAHECMKALTNTEALDNCDLFRMTTLTLRKCSKCETELKSCEPNIELILTRQDTAAESLNLYFGEEQMYLECDFCLATSMHSTKLLIESPSKILILKIVRASWINGQAVKDSKNMDLPEILDMSEFMTDQSMKVTYSLYSTILHYGEEAFKGHYTSLVNINGRFIEIDDQVVLPASRKYVGQCSVALYKLTEAQNTHPTNPSLECIPDSNTEKSNAEPSVLPKGSVDSVGMQSEAFMPYMESGSDSARFVDERRNTDHNYPLPHLDLAEPRVLPKGSGDSVGMQSEAFMPYLDSGAQSARDVNERRNSDHNLPLPHSDLDDQYLPNKGLESRVADEQVRIDQAMLQLQRGAMTGRVVAERGAKEHAYHLPPSIQAALNVSTEGSGDSMVGLLDEEFESLLDSRRHSVRIFNERRDEDHPYSLPPINQADEQKESTKVGRDSVVGNGVEELVSKMDSRSQAARDFKARKYKDHAYCLTTPLDEDDQYLPNKGLEARAAEEQDKIDQAMLQLQRGAMTGRVVAERADKEHAYHLGPSILAAPNVSTEGSGESWVGMLDEEFESHLDSRRHSFRIFNERKDADHPYSLPPQKLADEQKESTKVGRDSVVGNGVEELVSKMDSRSQAARVFKARKDKDHAYCLTTPLNEDDENWLSTDFEESFVGMQEEEEEQIAPSMESGAPSARDVNERRNSDHNHPLPHSDLDEVEQLQRGAYFDKSIAAKIVTDHQTPPAKKKPTKRKSATDKVLQDLGLLCSDEILTPRKLELIEQLKVLESQLCDMTCDLQALRKKTLRLAREKKQIQQQRREDNKLLNIIQRLRPKLSNEGYEILRTQILEADKLPQGRRYTLELKLISLAMYKSGPKCYRLLWKIFVLPSRITLLRLLNKLPMSPGVQIETLSLLKKRMQSLPRREKKVVLMFDGTSINPHLQYQASDKIIGYVDYGKGNRRNQVADEVLVFAIKPIFPRKGKRWIQVLGYHFVSKTMTAYEMADLIIYYVKVVFFILGLDLEATLCDQASTFVKAMLLLGAHVNKPFYEVLGKIILHLFDPPHELKCVRNLLSTNDLECQDPETGKMETVKFEYYSESISIDKSLGPKASYKLQESQLNPKGRDRMKVCYAAQLFSNTVFRTMKYQLQMAKGGLPAEALPTINFTKYMDSWYDSVNGSFYGTEVAGKELRRPVREGSQHHLFWKEFIDSVRTWRFVNSKGNTVSTPTLINMEWTVRALQLLWEKLSKEGFDELAPRELNQDPLENVFGMAKYFTLFKTPTPFQLEAALKTLLICHAAQEVDLVGGNCEAVEMHLLEDYLTLLSPLNEEFATLLVETEMELRELNLIDLEGNLIIFSQDISPENIDQSSPLTWNRPNDEDEGVWPLDVDDPPASQFFDYFSNEGIEDDVISIASSVSTESAFSDTEFEDSEMEEEELERAVMQIGVDAHVSGFFVKKLYKKLKCDKCKASVTTLDVECQNLLIHYREPVSEEESDKFLNYPSQSFNAVISSALRRTKAFLTKQSFVNDVRALVKTNLVRHFKFENFGCDTHVAKFENICVDYLSYVAIWWFVKDKNLNIESFIRKKPIVDTDLNMRRIVNQRMTNSYYSGFFIKRKRKKE